MHGTNYRDNTGHVNVVSVECHCSASVIKTKTETTQDLKSFNSVFENSAAQCGYKVILQLFGYNWDMHRDFHFY